MEHAQKKELTYAKKKNRESETPSQVCVPSSQQREQTLSVRTRLPAAVPYRCSCGRSALTRHWTKVLSFGDRQEPFRSWLCHPIS